MKIKLLLLTLLVGSLAQARDNGYEQLSKIKPKFTYLCLYKSGGGSFELSVVDDETILTSVGGVYRLKAKGKTEALYGIPPYFQLKINQSFLNGTEKKEQISLYDHNSSWFLDCHRLAQ